MKVSVSILKEYDRLIKAVKEVNSSSADYLHIDVMDGYFVEDRKFPIEVVRDIQSISTKPLDVHLMVESEELIKEYAKLKPEYLTFHAEIIKDHSIIDYVKRMGIKVGLAINPETDIELLLPYLDNLDLVLFMSVEPGIGGQKFMESVIKKIERLKLITNKNIIISIDGGINDKNVELCKYAGCNMVVVGSFITNSDNYDEMIKKLK